MASKCPEDVHISQTPAIASPKPKAKRDPNLGPVGFQKETSGSSWIPKLVNVYITNWKDPPCYFHWKNHYFDWAIFSSYLKNYQRILDVSNVC
jgi:hypothetical protein